MTFWPLIMDWHDRRHQLKKQNRGSMLQHCLIKTLMRVLLGLVDLCCSEFLCHSLSPSSGLESQLTSARMCVTLWTLKVELKVNQLDTYDPRSPVTVSQWPEAACLSDNLLIEHSEPINIVHICLPFRRKKEGPFGPVARTTRRLSCFVQMSDHVWLFRHRIIKKIQLTNMLLTARTLGTKSILILKFLYAVS